MNKLIIGAVLLFAGTAYATQVNPTSNVLGDTDATAGTLVLRDSSGEFSGAQLSAGTVVTAKLASSSVTTAKMWLELPSGQVLCVTTSKRIGSCTQVVPTTGVCATCNGLGS